MTGSLFSNDNKKNNETFERKVDNQTKAIFTVVERQKKLESLFENLNEKSDLLEKNITDNDSHSSKNIKSIREELKELKKEIEKLKEFSQKVKRELLGVTRKEDTDVLKKYIDLWEPMDFVTREELNKMKKEIIKSIEEVFK